MMQVNGSSPDQMSQWSITPGVPSRPTNEPYGDRYGTVKKHTARTDDMIRNITVYDLGSTVT